MAPAGPGESAGQDDDAMREAVQLSRGRTSRDIAAEARNREHDRTEVFRDHFELIAIITLYVVAACLAILLFCWLAHIVLPQRCQWMSKEQIGKVQGLVTGSVIARFALGHLKRRIGG